MLKKFRCTSNHWKVFFRLFVPLLAIIAGVCVGIYVQIYSEFDHFRLSALDERVQKLNKVASSFLITFATCVKDFQYVGNNSMGILQPNNYIYNEVLYFMKKRKTAYFAKWVIHERKEREINITINDNMTYYKKDGISTLKTSVVLPGINFTISYAVDPTPLLHIHAEDFASMYVIDDKGQFVFPGKQEPFVDAFPRIWEKIDKSTGPNLSVSNFEEGKYTASYLHFDLPSKFYFVQIDETYLMLNEAIHKQNISIIITSVIFSALVLVLVIGSFFYSKYRVSQDISSKLFSKLKKLGEKKHSGEETVDVDELINKTRRLETGDIEDSYKTIDDILIDSLCRSFFFRHVSVQGDVNTVTAWTKVRNIQEQNEWIIDTYVIVGSVLEVNVSDEERSKAISHDPGIKDILKQIEKILMDKYFESFKMSDLFQTVLKCENNPGITVRVTRGRTIHSTRVKAQTFDINDVHGPI